jgi:hypothetical protein
MPESPAVPTRAVPKVVCQIGLWSAVLTTLWIVLFDLSIVLTSQVLADASSLLIAVSFPVLVVALHNYARDEKKVWTQVALLFATAYMVIAAINYFLQLTVVRQNPQTFGFLTMNLTSSSAFWALEVLEYTFMSVAALFTVPIFERGRIESPIRWLFVLNAAFTFAGAAGYMLTVDPLNVLVLASLGIWSITFPIATALLAMLFRRRQNLNV